MWWYLSCMQKFELMCVDLKTSCKFVLDVDLSECCWVGLIWFIARVKKSIVQKHNNRQCWWCEWLVMNYFYQVNSDNSCDIFNHQFYFKYNVTTTSIHLNLSTAGMKCIYCVSCVKKYMWKTCRASIKCVVVEIIYPIIAQISSNMFQINKL